GDEQRRTAAAERATARDLRRGGPGDRRDRDLRRPGVLGDAAHARNRRAHRARRAAARRRAADRPGRDARRAARHRRRIGGRARAEPRAGEPSVRRPRRRSTHFRVGRRGVDAGRARRLRPPRPPRLARRSLGGATDRVIGFGVRGSPFGVLVLGFWGSGFWFWNRELRTQNPRTQSGFRATPDWSRILAAPRARGPMTQRKSNRRRFITGLGATAAAAGAGAITAHAQTPAGGHPQATRHATDDWMDALPNKHRMVVDGVTANGAGEAVLFASNLYAANKAAYQVGEGDLGIIVVMRHFATPFAFTDAMWAKYGKAMSAMLDFKDPKTKEAPTTNLFNSSAYGLTLPNLGNTIDALITRGTHFAVCDMAMHFAA